MRPYEPQHHIKCPRYGLLAKTCDRGRGNRGTSCTRLIGTAHGSVQLKSQNHFLNDFNETKELMGEFLTLISSLGSSSQTIYYHA